MVHRPRQNEKQRGLADCAARPRLVKSIARFPKKIERSIPDPVCDLWLA
jgi:hypothetical protein